MYGINLLNHRIQRKDKICHNSIANGIRSEKETYVNMQPLYWMVANAHKWDFIKESQM